MVAASLTTEKLAWHLREVLLLRVAEALIDVEAAGLAGKAKLLEGHSATYYVATSQTAVSQSSAGLICSVCYP